MTPGDLVADRYRILYRIGEGGMGAVWAAHDELAKRSVAVKVMGEQIADRPDARKRFMNEARAISRLRHENIVSALGFGELAEACPYIVLELLDGLSLEMHLDEVRRIGADEAVLIAIEICRGLGAAHRAGVVHRDLTPSNVFLYEKADGTKGVKLLDFGMSKSILADDAVLVVTRAGVALGTARYMSAEQARGLANIDARTDLWSLGVILYEMVSGTLPFNGPNYNAVLAQIVDDEPPPLRSDLEVPASLVAVIARCLSKERDERFQSTEELAEALDAIMLELPRRASGIAARPQLRSVPDLDGTSGQR